MKKILLFLLIVLLLIGTAEAVTISSIGNTTMKAIELGSGTTTGGKCASFSDNNWTLDFINLTGNNSFRLATLEYYVAGWEQSANIGDWTAGIFTQNSTGGIGSLIGSNLTLDSIVTPLGYRNVSNLSLINLIDGTPYWLVWSRSSVAGKGAYLGQTSGTPNILFHKVSSLNGALVSVCDTNSLNIRFWGYYLNLTNGTYNNMIYNNLVSVGSNNTFIFNITSVNGGLASGSAILNYNGTNYNMNTAFSNSTDYSFSVNTIAPVVNTNTNYPFNVTYNLNGTSYISQNYLQQINPTPALTFGSNCSSPYIPVINMTLYDEMNLTQLKADTYNYNFYYGVNNVSSITSYGSVNGSSSLVICANSSYSTSWSLESAEVDYSKTNWANRRYYFFNRTQLNSDTLNISLYDIFNNDAQAFQLIITDTSGNGIANRYTTLVRWYPALNNYNVVDMGLTDETGSTIIYVKSQDVDYRIGVYYKNGTLIKLANPIRMVCISAPCSYTFRISPAMTDYLSLLNVQYTFTFNYTTNIWSFVYSDPSQKTITMNMTIYAVRGDSDYVICSSTNTGFVGAMTCNTTGYTGTLRGVVTRTAESTIDFVQLIVQSFVPQFTGKWALWLSVLVAIPIIFLFSMISPYAALVGGVIALIPALVFGSIGIGIVGAFAIMAAIIAHFIGRKS